MTTTPVGGAQPTFLQTDRTLARAIRPIVRFTHVEAASGIVLVAATAVALLWANSPWAASYETLWSTHVRIEVGPYVFDENLTHFVNDVLMAVFFFVVGMEIKRELVVGELRDRRNVALPAMAAVGGMVVPALIYVAFNAGDVGARGWGIPMATDIAFAIGIVALLGARVPTTVKVLVLTLAIVDDIGAIIVIAVFYSERVRPGFLVAAALVTGAVALMHRTRVVYPPLIVAAGVALWFTVYESGIHATIAGVAMGLLMPARPIQPDLEATEVAAVLEGSETPRATDVRSTSTLLRDSVSPCDRLIDALHPWSSFLVVPLFALANAGIVVSVDTLSSPSAVLVGVAVALVVGKFAGITLFAWLAVRLGLGRLPDGARWGHLVGVGAVAGIGFTVSLFITGLAFEDPGTQLDAKTGILVASVVSAVAGATILARVARADRPSSMATRRPQ